MVTIDEKIMKKIEDITITNYEYENGSVPAENVEAMLEDLLLEIERLEEKYKELEDMTSEMYS